MPEGFVGSFAANYLTAIEEVLSVARLVHMQNPFANLSNWAVPPPALPARFNRDQTHPPETARSGGYSTDVGTSNNVVVDQGEYQDILRKIDIADDKIGESLYNISSAINDLCSTSFRLRMTVPRCLDISESVKTSMGEFRSLTESAAIKMRAFSRDITAIS